MKCKYCGAEIPDTALFCSECGTAVKAMDPVQESPVNTAPVNAEPFNTSDTVQPSDDRPGSGAQSACGQPGYDQPYNGSTQQTYSQTYHQTYSGAYQQEQGYPQYTQSPKKTTPTLSIIGLVLGILSILCGCCYGIGLLFGIPGLILSIMGNKDTKSGIGTAGMICSIIGIVLSVIMALYIIAVVGANYSDFADLYRSIYRDTYYNYY